MSNINDYLEWRGDLPICNKHKFNEIDGMILARFSYLNFSKIQLHKKETIKSISTKMINLGKKDFRYNGDKEMITLLGESNRFSDMYVTDFIEHYDKAVEKQFSAITIHISPKEIYVSFIGTDETLIGWKEDFNMAFMETIPAQLEGLKYLQKIAKKYPDTKIRIGGHSKGGNIAVFSAISTNQEIQKRIIKIYSYDGPGLDKSILDNVKNKNIFKKINSYIPQDSIIGRILEHKETPKVIQSTEKGLLQHDIFSWQVKRDEPVLLEKATNESELMNKTISSWLKETKIEQRKIFIDGMYDVLSSTEINTIDELTISLSKRLPIFIRTYRNMPEEDRRIISQALREFGKAYATMLRRSELKKK